MGSVLDNVAMSTPGDVVGSGAAAERIGPSVSVFEAQGSSSLLVVGDAFSGAQIDEHHKRVDGRAAEHSDGDKHNKQNHRRLALQEHSGEIPEVGHPWSPKWAPGLSNDPRGLKNLRLLTNKST